ncbi:MAG: tRNA threonylcarbamoyladenosine biosynthesis protein TsaB, partial [Aquificaceae bacterium]
LPMVLEELKIEAENMDAFAVSLGVGYLTSLRIGITFMKTLAYLRGKPIVGYENLHMMCLFVKSKEERAVALRVSSNIFYRICKGQQMGEIEVLKDRLPEVPLVGLASQGIGDIQLEYFPFSLYGGLWAYRKLSEGYEGDNPMLLEPLYLKPPV